MGVCLYGACLFCLAEEILEALGKEALLDDVEAVVKVLEKSEYNPKIQQHSQSNHQTTNAPKAVV